MKMHHQYATEVHPDTDKEKNLHFCGNTWHLLKQCLILNIMMKEIKYFMIKSNELKKKLLFLD